MSIAKKIQTSLLVCAVILISFSLSSAESVFDSKRNALIGYMLYKQLPPVHFSDKKMDDGVAQAAFDLYIKQLDYQKRFLLQEDIQQLEKYKLQIDDNLKRGSIVLPDVGFTLLATRITAVENLVKQLLDGDFETAKDEYYETDPEKLEFAGDMEELRNRWRKILKAQVISRYLSLKEEEDKKEKPEDETVLWNQAKERVGSRNSEFFNRLKQENLQDHYDRFFNAVTRAFDPHTNYMAPSSKEDFDIHMRGSLEGIGALLREEAGYIKVVRIIPGSASARQGRLLAEDIILQVAEGDQEPVEVTDMRLRDAVRLIRGPIGTEVRLTVRKPDGTTEIIPIIRDVVQIEDSFVKRTTLSSEAGVKIGYIMIPSFYRDFETTRNGGSARNSTDDTRLALQELIKENISGLILDLRDNGGGSLLDAVDITGLFLKSGPVVQVKNSFGARQILADDDEELVYEGPLVVLVNLFSASASEILAAALQDYGRAVIVGGKHTHGKGTVQTIIDMNDNVPLLQLQRYDDLGALKVTIQKFYRINGGSTQFKGVIPDIILPSLFDYLETGEQYLDYSLPWDQVSAVPYSPYSAGYINMEEIREKSSARISRDEGLKIIADEALKSKDRLKNTSISLKLDEMKRERDEANRTREIVGSHYKKYQEGQRSEFDTPVVDDITKEESTDGWVEELQEDPYVGEAARIVGDILSKNKS
ncbi:MAG: carboxy terminal-processing peptidase [Desulfopila sp.]|jgi:carboxyl-terminal processing protease|nr:carboxy terminal-processing peptidase [Desulfopila sp.]